MHVGLGPIGALVARQIASRKGFRIVGAVDVDPGKVGRDLGDVIEAGRTLRLRVTDDIGRTIKATKPDVAVLCTSSSLKVVLPQFEDVLKRRVPIVTTTEEAAYPAPRNRRLAKRLDAAAKKAKVAVLGTGVNPGFTMDALPIALSAVCERVDRIEVHRVQDARIRRLPFQQKIGAGLTREQFDRQVELGTVRHVGFTESIQMIGDAMGCVRGAPLITLRLEAYLGAPDSYDSVLIEGSPRIHSTIAGGVHGDIATASITVNSIPAVLTARPGLRTMRDVRLPSFFSGT
jgi:hypothetical protein